MKPQPTRQRPLTRNEQLWAAARDLASGDGGQRWELEPPVAVLERRRAALPHCEGGPFTPEEQQWLLDTPCQEVLNQVHVKEVGGSTKAAQAAAAIAQQRRPAAPYRLVTWRHIHTGASLAVEVPLSVFRKQRGAVFRKWQQRAWRALHALRCEVGEEVWPEGCREAAAAGAPCWDELAEETAALAKLPFCMPQKCKVQLLGLGTIKRFKSEVLGKRKAGDRGDDATASGADKRAQHRMRAAMWMGQEWLLSPQHEDSQASQQHERQPGRPNEQPAPLARASARPASPQPPTPQKLQQRQVALDPAAPQWQEQQQAQQQERRRERRGTPELLRHQQRQQPGATHQGKLDCATPTAAQEQTSCLTALFDDIAMAGGGDASAEGTSPMRCPSAQPCAHEVPPHFGGTPTASAMARTPLSRRPSASVPYSVEEHAAATPAASSWLASRALLMADQQEERSPVSSLKDLFQQCTSQGGAAGGAQARAHPEPQLLRNSSQGSLASGLECASHLGLLGSGHGDAAGGRPAPQADRLLLRISSQGSSSSGFNGLECGPPVIVQGVCRRSRGGVADTAAVRPGSAGVPSLPSSTERGGAGAAPSPGLGQQLLRNDSRHSEPSTLRAQGWPLSEAAAQERLSFGKGSSACGWAGAADWLLQFSDARAGKLGGRQAGSAAGVDQLPARGGQPSRGISALCFEDSLDLLLQGCATGSAFWHGKGSPVLQELLQACSPGGATPGGCNEGAFRGEASLGPWLCDRKEGPDAQQHSASQDGTAAGRTSTLQRLLAAAAAAATQGEPPHGAQPAGAAAASAGWQDDFAKWLLEAGQRGAAGVPACSGAGSIQGARMLGGQDGARYPALVPTEVLLQGRGSKVGPAVQQPARRTHAPPSGDFMSDAEFHAILDQLFSS